MLGRKALRPTKRLRTRASRKEHSKWTLRGSTEVQGRFALVRNHNGRECLSQILPKLSLRALQNRNTLGDFLGLRNTLGRDWRAGRRTQQQGRYNPCIHSELSTASYHSQWPRQEPKCNHGSLSVKRFSSGFVAASAFPSKGSAAQVCFRDRCGLRCPLAEDLDGRRRRARPVKRAACELGYTAFEDNVVRTAARIAADAARALRQGRDPRQARLAEVPRVDDCGERRESWSLRSCVLLPDPWW